MGTPQSKENSNSTNTFELTSAQLAEMRAALKLPARNLNILLIGDTRNGKSALINTIFWATTEKRAVVKVVVGNPNGEGRTTVDYRAHEVAEINMTFYDIPGADYTSQVQRNFVRECLAGLEPVVNLASPNLNDSSPKAEKDALFAKIASHRNPRRSIDFCILVVDATKFEKREEQGWFSRILFNPTYNAVAGEQHAFGGLVRDIVNGCKSNYHPLVVFTKMDMAHISLEQLIAAAPDWATQSTWGLYNYTRALEQVRTSTEAQALSIVSTIRECSGRSV